MTILRADADGKPIDMIAANPTGQSCDNCFFFLKAPAQRPVMKLCRRYPATVGTQQGSTGPGWVTVEEDDWCGEWKAIPAPPPPPPPPPAPAQMPSS